MSGTLREAWRGRIVGAGGGSTRVGTFRGGVAGGGFGVLLLGNSSVGVADCRRCTSAGGDVYVALHS